MDGLWVERYVRWLREKKQKISWPVVCSRRSVHNLIPSRLVLGINCLEASLHDGFVVSQGRIAANENAAPVGVQSY